MRCKADFGNYPNRLWSIPELATHIVSTYINLVRVIADARMNFAFRPKGELIDDVIRLSVRSGFAEILDGVSAQHYPITFKHLGRMVQKMESPITAADIQDFLRELEARLDVDIEDHEYIQVFRPQYYNQITPFGETVFNNLASANDDIYEAGMCLAFKQRHSVRDAPDASNGGWLKGTCWRSVCKATKRLGRVSSRNRCQT